MITHRVIIGMRKWGTERQNTQNSGKWPAGYTIPRIRCKVLSLKKLDVRLEASTPLPCFKNLLSENSELQHRLDEEIGPGRLSDFS